MTGPEAPGRPGAAAPRQQPDRDRAPDREADDHEEEHRLRVGAPDWVVKGGPDAAEEVRAAARWDRRPARTPRARSRRAGACRRRRPPAPTRPRSRSTNPATTDAGSRGVPGPREVAAGGPDEAVLAHEQRTAIAPTGSAAAEEKEAGALPGPPTPAARSRPAALQTAATWATASRTWASGPAAPLGVNDSDAPARPGRSAPRRPRASRILRRRPASPVPTRRRTVPAPDPDGVGTPGEIPPGEGRLGALGTVGAGELGLGNDGAAGGCGAGTGGTGGGGAGSDGV